MLTLWSLNNERVCKMMLIKRQHRCRYKYKKVWLINNVHARLRGYLSSLHHCSAHPQTAVQCRRPKWTPRQRPPTAAEHSEAVFPLTRSLPSLNKSWQGVPASRSFLFYLLSCRSSDYALEKPQKRRGKEKHGRGATGGGAKSLFPWKWHATVSPLSILRYWLLFAGDI